MKIDNSSNALLLATSRDSKLRAPITKSGDNASSTDANGTSVNLGKIATQLRSLASNETNTAPFNASKVAEIKQAISEGRFMVNAGAVPDSLIKSVTDLIATHKI